MSGATQRRVPAAAVPGSRTGVAARRVTFCPGSRADQPGKLWYDTPGKLGGTSVTCSGTLETVQWYSTDSN